MRKKPDIIIYVDTTTSGA